MFLTVFIFLFLACLDSFSSFYLSNQLKRVNHLADVISFYNAVNEYAVSQQAPALYQSENRALPKTSSFKQPNFLRNSFAVADQKPVTAKVLKGSQLQSILKNPLERSKFLIIDVRNPEEMKQVYLEGKDILNIPLGEESKWSKSVEKIERMDSTKPAIVVCATGFRSKIFASFMTRSGFKEVYMLDKGLGNYAATVDPSIIHQIK